MKVFPTGIWLIAALLLLANAPLWAGSSKTIFVSCVVEPRLSAQMEQEQELTTKTDLPVEFSSSAPKGRLLQKKEFRKTNLPPPYASAIVYTYSAR